MSLTEEKDYLEFYYTYDKSFEIKEDDILNFEEYNNIKKIKEEDSFLCPINGVLRLFLTLSEVKNDKSFLLNLNEKLEKNYISKLDTNADKKSVYLEFESKIGI